MSAKPHRDRRAERYAAMRREILEASWELVRSDGLGALSMRELGSRVGVRAQSLYAYFPSKFAILDAMFAESNEELLRRLSALKPGLDPATTLRAQKREFIEFCVEDPARYQLLFQRTIPGFQPSPEAYAPALEVLECSRAALRACGITSERAMDVWTAVTGGIAAQQNANEPGGERWSHLADEVTDMFLAHYRPAKQRGKP